MNTDGDEIFDDYQLLINLLNITSETIEDPETAFLLVERPLFHFMRLTTTRRNNRQIVSEEELSLALPIAEKIFGNASILPLCLHDENNQSIVESCVLVMLNELLCFIDFSGEDENARKNDPPSFHTRRLQCAIDLMKRVSSHNINNNNNEVTSLFRKTLPGIASRTISQISTVMNSSTSYPATKAQRESCLFCLRLLKSHLEGCDFPNFVQEREGLSAFVRVSGLCSTLLCDALKKFVLTRVGNNHSSSLSPWFDNGGFSSDFSSSFIDLILFLFGDNFLFAAATVASSEKDQDRIIVVKNAIQTLTTNLLQCYVLVSRFFPTTRSRRNDEKIESCFLENFDQNCFESNNHLLNVMIFESATCSFFRNRKDKIELITKNRFLRQLLCAFTKEISAELKFQTKTSIDGININDQEPDVDDDDEEFLMEKTRSTRKKNLLEITENNVHHSSGRSTNASLFEKWLGTSFDVNSTSYPLAFLQEDYQTDEEIEENYINSSIGATKALPSSSIPFLMLVAKNAAMRGYFFTLPEQKSATQCDDDAEDDDDPNAILISSIQSWLESTVIPVLSDPHSYSNHHALLLILISVFYQLFFCSSSPNSLSLIKSEFMWSELWNEIIWEKIILSPYLRNVSQHWDLCNGAQKRFRTSICALISKLIAVFGCGMGLEIHLLASTKKKKSSKKTATMLMTTIPDAGERFLLLSVRELLDIVSTDLPSLGDSSNNNKILNQAAMNSLNMIAGSFFPPQGNEHFNNSNSSLHRLIRHCLPSITDTCTRTLSSSSTKIGEKISNAKILHAATLLAVEETISISSKEKTSSSRQLSKSTIMELSPQIQIIGQTCYKLLRKYSSSLDEGIDECENDSEAKRMHLRVLLFKISITITDFAASAQRAQDQSWNNAVAAFVQTAKPSEWKKGNILRIMYKKKILEKEANPGQVNLMPSNDEEWIDTEDFTSFVEPFVSRLHENSIYLLGCAVASLNSEYYFDPSATTTTTTANANDTSLLRIGSVTSQTENAESDVKQIRKIERIQSVASKTMWWNVPAASLSSEIGHNSSGSFVSSAVDVISEKRRDDARKKAKFSSVAERAAAIHLASSCLIAVSTTTPSNYFETSSDYYSTMTPEKMRKRQQMKRAKEQKDDHDKMNSQNEVDEDDTADEATENTNASATISNKQELILAGAQKYRISRGHWTSVFKLFHSLESLLLSSSTGNNGFRDIPSAISFFFDFGISLVKYRKLTKNSATESSSNREKEKLRINIKNHIQTIKNTKLIADESIAQTPKAFDFLTNAAPVFILYRTQTEVLPLLALHWLAICQEKEPEVWSHFILNSSGENEAQQQQQQPRTQLGKKFLTEFLILKKTCGMTDEALLEKESVDAENEQNNEKLPTPDDDIKKVAMCLAIFGLV